jgi:predicted ribosome quality control (RQC) complex YloA/Tae2 family protein
MAKESMSVIDVAAWVSSTGKQLVETSRVVNIYRADGKFYFKLHTKKAGRELLVVEPGRRIHFTRTEKPPGEYKQDSLLAALRKYVRGRIISRVQQVNHDRIVELNVREYSVITELMKNGVIALLDAEGNIVVASEYRRMRDRVLKPKEKYVPPPNNSVPLPELTIDKLVDRVEKGKDLVRGLVRGLGVPGEFAEEAIYRAGIDKSVDPRSLGETEFEKLHSVLIGLYREALLGKGYVVYDGDKPVIAVSFKPTSSIDAGLRVEEFESFDDALDVMYSRKEVAIKPIEKAIEEEVGRVLASIEKQRKLREDYIEKAEKLREEALFISNHYIEFEKLLGFLKKTVSGKGWDQLKSFTWVKSMDPASGIVVVSVKDMMIRLDLKKSLDEIINELYKKAGELEGKARRAERSLRDLEETLREARKRAVKRYLSNFYKKRRREWFEKYIWSFTRNGFLVIAGRNADQNESLVKKYLSDEDIYMHAEIHGAPSTIIKTQGQDLGEADLMDAAVIAASYSRAWKVGAGYVDVFWVKGSQVSKTPPSGEYITKGAFMVYGKKNYLRGVRLELAVGLEPVEGGYLRVITGSEQAVKSRSWIYASIVPGDNPEESLGEFMARIGCRLSPSKCIILESFPGEEISKMLPGKYGKPRVALGDAGYEPPFDIPL